MNELFDPICDGIQYVTYHRNPTEAEIAFGYGAIHYRNFPIDYVRKEDGRLKVWLKAEDDNLRYYR